MSRLIDADKLKSLLGDNKESLGDISLITSYIDSLPTEVVKSHSCGGNCSCKSKGTASPLKSEYSAEFDKLRKNRVELSYFKYGSARDNYGGGRVDALKSAERCLDVFKKDKNTEHLVDATNYLMFRYMYPLGEEYFEATDSSKSVGLVGTPITQE